MHALHCTSLGMKASAKCVIFIKPGVENNSNRIIKFCMICSLLIYQWLSVQPNSYLIMQKVLESFGLCSKSYISALGSFWRYDYADVSWLWTDTICWRLYCNDDDKGMIAMSQMKRTSLGVERNTASIPLKKFRFLNSQNFTIKTKWSISTK